MSLDIEVTPPPRMAPVTCSICGQLCRDIRWHCRACKDDGMGRLRVCSTGCMALHGARHFTTERPPAAPEDGDL
ncbi:MAG: hypothetical protein JO086_00150 [Acidimicrobiia bacterium]|nr:hypothetical protein [Acidimicrobiia bacterium]